MNRLRATMVRAFADAESLGHPWALVGGLAVSARVEPRLTRDVDIALGVHDDAEAEAIVRELLARGYEMVAGIEHRVTGRLATVRLRPSLETSSGALVDLLFASSGIEAEVAARAQRVEILPGVLVPVATLADLIAMKVLARDDRRRPQDHDDLVALIGIASVDEIADAEAAISLVVQRGYDRGKMLQDELRALVAEITASR